jgi:hypothetical protein
MYLFQFSTCFDTINSSDNENEVARNM